MVAAPLPRGPMHHAPSGRLLVALAGALLAIAGCGDPDLEGHYWSITARGVENSCTSGPPDAEERFDYRVRYDGNEIQVAIGPDLVATGAADGCSLVYQSTIWTDERDGAEITWRLTGHAVAQQAGAACTIPNGTDWDGTETFEVVSSSHPDISAGCSYVLDLSGDYLEEVK